MNDFQITHKAVTAPRYRKRTKKQEFNPDRDFVNKAMLDYKKKGGKISKIIPVFSESNGKDVDTIDEFLCPAVMPGQVF